MPRPAVAIGPQREPLVRQPDFARQFQIRLLAPQPHPVHMHDVVGERKPDRTVVVQLEVEHRERQTIGADVDLELLEVEQLPVDGDSAAGHQRRHLRQPRLHGSDERVEAGVGHTETKPSERLVRQPDVAGARDRDVRRRRLQLDRHDASRDVETSRHLSDRSTRHGHIGHRAPDFVARVREGAGTRDGGVDTPADRYRNALGHPRRGELQIAASAVTE